MLKQSQIDRKLNEIKGWYIENYPLCLFCGHFVKDGDLAHLIRRSGSRELQTLKLNTGLAHRDCHDIFDNDFSQSVFLPRIIECLYIIYLLDEQYFYLIAEHYRELSHILQLFPEVPYQDIEHHGEILSLQYLIT
jgi:hypothetical protein